MAVQKKKKKNIKNIPYGIAHIKSTFNNTIITVSDPDGNVLGWCASGVVGYKGAKKGTPYAAQQSAENLAEKLKDFGLVEVDVLVKGPGSGRETAIRALQSMGIEVRSIKDVTPMPHNGCRPRKKRRV